MKHQSRWLYLGICFTLLVLVMACRIPNPFSTSEPTPIPPTATIAPTATSIPTPTLRVPRTVTLSPNGSGDYPDLASAAADLLSGSTIILEAGTYQLDETLTIDKALTLQGAGSELTIITSSDPGGVFDYSADYQLVLKGISFIYEGTEWSNVGEIESGKFEIDDCLFSGGVRSASEGIGGNGLFIQGSSFREDHE